jgi:hypothetical protein
VDGFTIVEDYLTEDQLVRFREGLIRCLNTYRGRNPFEGLATERVHAGGPRQNLRGDRLRPSAARNPRPSARAQLPAERRPRHLHLSRREAQALHFDDGFYPFPRPRRAISISVIGAIDAFTPENGGTVLYRGSHNCEPPHTSDYRSALF